MLVLDVLSCQNWFVLFEQYTSRNLSTRIYSDGKQTICVGRYFPKQKPIYDMLPRAYRIRRSGEFLCRHHKSVGVGIHRTHRTFISGLSRHGWKTNSRSPGIEFRKAQLPIAMLCYCYNTWINPPIPSICNQFTNEI